MRLHRMRVSGWARTLHVMETQGLHTVLGFDVCSTRSIEEEFDSKGKVERICFCSF